VNETIAQEVLLVRAVEGTDTAGKILTEDDRNYAGRAAAELVRWQALEQGERVTAEAFVAKRAELLAAKLAERSPKAWRAIKSFHWRPWTGLALPLIAFVIGAATEHIADRRHLNILAFPLLGLVAWNIAVYLWLIVWGTIGVAGKGSRKPGWLQTLVAGARRNFAGRATGALGEAIANFSLEWAQRSAPLVAARAGRVLHVSAAMLALGAIAGLYLRGMVFEYRAGWESTFLEPNAVHAILALFLQPAASLVGQPLPTVDQLAALRLGEGGTGENAGRWIHLYAVTVMVSVIVPRVLLAVVAWYRERGLSTRFPLSLDEPYFRRVLAHWRESPARVRVLPYAYTPEEASAEGLHRLAALLFGKDAHFHISPPVAFGDEDSPAAGAGRGTPAADLVIALFNLASTPETENHGVFLDAVKSQANGAVAVVVDESRYRQRLGAQAGADARLAERRQTWSGFAAARGIRAVFADLEAPDLSAAERELDAQLSSVKALA